MLYGISSLGKCGIPRQPTTNSHLLFSAFARRFLDRDVRKAEFRKQLSALEIPPGCYLPLCNSTDPWVTVRRVLPGESHLFSTKARCPGLVLFESERHPLGMDVASFLAGKFARNGGRSDHVLGGGLSSPSSARIGFSEKSDTGSVFDLDVDPSASSEGEGRVRSVSRAEVWVEKGVGMRRVMSANLSLSEGGSEDGRPRPSPSAEQQAVEAELTAAMDDPSGGVVASRPPPAAAFFGESFTQKSERVRLASSLGSLSGWTLQGLIAKSNDDLRQEVWSGLGWGKSFERSTCLHCCTPSA